MRFDEIDRQVGGIPFINPRNARLLYDFITENKGIRRVLELGFAHGTASCYIAAALEENDGGQLTAVDLVETEDEFKPSINDLLTKTGLSNVDVIREKTGYTWFLHNEIERNTVAESCEAIYDLCIIDGPKNWTIDGAAFFMADKLLKDGGWMIFDDYSWTYADSERQGYESTDGVTHRGLSRSELETPQIREVFHLLVMQHPNYGNFKIHGEGDWAWAQKISDASAKNLTIKYNIGYKDIVSRLYSVLRPSARRK